MILLAIAVVPAWLLFGVVAGRVIGRMWGDLSQMEIDAMIDEAAARYGL